MITVQFKDEETVAFALGYMNAAEMLQDHKTVEDAIEGAWGFGCIDTQVTFKWPGVAKIIQDNIMSWEDEAAEIYASDLRTLADLKDAYDALVTGTSFGKEKLTEILKKELHLYEEGFADTSLWPGRDPDYAYNVRHYASRVKLLTAALKTLKET